MLSFPYQLMPFFAICNHLFESIIMEECDKPYSHATHTYIVVDKMVASFVHCKQAESGILIDWNSTVSSSARIFLVPEVTIPFKIFIDYKKYIYCFGPFDWQVKTSRQAGHREELNGAGAHMYNYLTFSQLHSSCKTISDQSRLMLGLGEGKELVK